MHAFIVVIISSSADCKTERTIVHEKHKSPKRTHLTYSQSQVLCIYSIFITFIHVYDSCLDLWLMICESLWNTALSPSPSCRVASVSESYFKTKGSDGIQIEWRVFRGFFFFWRWEMGVDRVVSALYFLTVAAWLISEKVPLGKYSGLPGLNAEFLVWRRQLAAASRSCTRRPQRPHTASGSHAGNVCLYIHGCIGHAWGMWTIDMAPRQGSTQRSSARSTGVQVMSEEKRSRLLFLFFFFKVGVCFKTTKLTRIKYLLFAETPAFWKTKMKGRSRKTKRKCVLWTGVQI